jgi:very-short-patch-repair endonuclease
LPDFLGKGLILGRLRGSEPVHPHKPSPEQEQCAGERPIHALAHNAPIAAKLWSPEQVKGTGDAEIARIAGVQRGYVIRAQLLAAGIGRGAIAHRLENGRLHERYRGVYLVGHTAPQPLGDETAAVLFLAGFGVLSDGSSSNIWGFYTSPDPGVTLTTVGRSCRSRPGLTIHRTETLDPRDIRLRAGLPVTAPARTLLDLAGELPIEQLERALAEARVQKLVTDDELRAAATRAPGRKGAGLIRRLLEAGPQFTRKGAERLMLRLLRAAQLPRPLTNIKLCGYNTDFFWRDQGLIVETDGYQFHSDRRAFERDRKRDQVHVAAGYRVIRVTWMQLQNEPFAVIARIAQALVVATRAA